ncbi:MAG: M15 family metallopeptidase, partial [Bacillota bacterium]|nr:M15 family metallopeptidase [Bacillota bacterium]
TGETEAPEDGQGLSEEEGEAGSGAEEGEETGAAPEEGEETGSGTEEEEGAGSLPGAADSAAEPMGKEEAEAQGVLLLVNKQHPLSPDYRPEDLTSIKYYAADRSESGRYMRAEAAEAFHRLVETAAAEEGYTIVMTTAYRSYSFQKILWDNYVAQDGEALASTYSARPGTSEHQTGLAVDVSSPSVNYRLTREYGETAEGAWLRENAHRFGFIIRFPQGKEEITGYNYEPWHLRYVGEEAAAEIYEQGITLEEYLLL